MRSHQSGFTLLEICIAIAIFAIGALTAMSILVPAVRWGGDAQKDLGGPEAALSAYQYLTSGGTLYKTTSNDTTDIFNGRTRAATTVNTNIDPYDADILNAKHYPYVVVITDMMTTDNSNQFSQNNNDLIMTNNQNNSNHPHDPVVSDIFIRDGAGILGKIKPNVLFSGKLIRVYRKRLDPFAEESQGMPTYKVIDKSQPTATNDDEKEKCLFYTDNDGNYVNIIDEDLEKPGAQPLFMMAVNLFRPE